MNKLSSIKGLNFKGKLFLILGPSGSGKGSVIEALKNQYPGFVFPVSLTTREAREGEIPGQVYDFVSKEEFERKLSEDAFLEHALVHGVNYYGILKKPIFDGLEAGAVIVREVDMQGFDIVREVIPKENLVSIFINVEEGEDDLRRRIDKRGELPEEEFERRMESMKKEIAKAGQCDYVVVNKWNCLNDTVREVERIILDEIKDLY